MEKHAPTALDVSASQHRSLAADAADMLLKRNTRTANPQMLAGCWLWPTGVCRRTLLRLQCGACPEKMPSPSCSWPALRCCSAP